MLEMLPHAYYSEVVQTAAAVVGFTLGIWAVWDARKDEMFWISVLEDEKRLGRASLSTEARTSIAKVHVQSELSTLVGYVILLVVGVSGMLLPPPDWYARALQPELLGISISRYGMTALTCVLAHKSLIRRRGRITYIRTIRRSTDGGARLALPSGMALREPGNDR